LYEIFSSVSLSVKTHTHYYVVSLFFNSYISSQMDFISRGDNLNSDI